MSDLLESLARAFEKGRNNREILNPDLCEKLLGEVAQIEAELAKHRWVPVSEITEDQSDRPLLVFHPDWGWESGSYYQGAWNTGFLVRVDPTHFMPITLPTQRRSE